MEPDQSATILLVEDDPLTRIATAEDLRCVGYAVVEARNASEAVEVLASRCVMVHLVFTDLQMDGPLDGLGLLGWIKENKPAMPVAAVSGSDRALAKARAFCPAELTFSKPCDIDRVVAAFRRCLGDGPFKQAEATA